MTQVTTSTEETVLDPGRVGLRINREPAGADSRDVSRISVELLGGLRVRAGGTTMGPRELGGAKVRRILLALLLQRGAPVSKERLVSLLWDGRPPGGAKATLESYVSVLRKTLQPHQSARASLIMTVADGYAIDMSRVDLDLARYEALLSGALRTDVAAVDALPALEAAMTLAGSPLLPDEFGCEWLDEARRIHDQGIRQSLIAAANKVAGLAPGSAERWARLALEGDPLDESAWHALLGCMESSGQHADGLRAYDDCRRLFGAELVCLHAACLCFSHWAAPRAQVCRNCTSGCCGALTSITAGLANFSMPWSGCTWLARWARDCPSQQWSATSPKRSARVARWIRQSPR